MKIVFAGIGALGSAAVVLCRNLVDREKKPIELRLIDCDLVEAKNLTAQVFVRQSLSQNKAEAMRAQLLNFWGVKAEAMRVRCTADNVAALCKGADLVVDCFDNAASRKVLSAHCSRRSMQRIYEINNNPGQHVAEVYGRNEGPSLVHAGISGSGDFGLVRWDERFVPDVEDVAGQATCEGGENLPFLGLLGGAIALTIQEFVRDGTMRDRMVSPGRIEVTL